MNISKLSKFAWAFFALVFTTATVFGQGYRNRNYDLNNQNKYCLNQFTELTEKQTTEIEELNSKHQEKMNVLREDHRSTSDAIKKNEIRRNILRTKKSHWEEIYSLLNDKQKEEFELLNNQANGYGRVNYQRPGQFLGQQLMARNADNVIVVQETGD